MYSGLSAPMGTVDPDSGLKWGPMEIPPGLWRSMQTWTAKQRYDFLKTWASQKSETPGESAFRQWSGYTPPVTTGDSEEDLVLSSLSDRELLARLQWRPGREGSLTWDDIPADLQTRMLSNPRIRPALERLFRQWGRRSGGDGGGDGGNGTQPRRRRRQRTANILPLKSPVIYTRSEAWRRRNRGLNGRRSEMMERRREMREQRRREALENLPEEQRQRRADVKEKIKAQKETEEFFGDYGLIAAALGVGLLLFTFLKK